MTPPTHTSATTPAPTWGLMHTPLKHSTPKSFSSQLTPHRRRLQLAELPRPTGTRHYHHSTAPSHAVATLTTMAGEALSYTSAL